MRDARDARDKRDAREAHDERVATRAAAKKLCSKLTVG
jgi:hypothetical protein